MAAAARPDPIILGDSVSDESGAPCAAQFCDCRPIVARAYFGMRAAGAGHLHAVEVAGRVLRFHHPACADALLHPTVEAWVGGPPH